MSEDANYIGEVVQNGKNNCEKLYGSKAFCLGSWLENIIEKLSFIEKLAY